MKFKLLLFIATFIGLVGVTHQGVFAQSLPTFVYLGGGHANTPVGTWIENDDKVLNRLVVKRYTPARFELLRAGVTRVQLGGSEGCITGKGPCNIDEVWKTDSTVEPKLYAPGAPNIALVDEIGWVTERDYKKNKCVFRYVLIDDDGETNDREGFYSTTEKWTKNTLPANLTFCTKQNNSFPSTPNTSVPIHCSSGPSSTMVSTGSFNVPRDGNMYIVSRESIGYASTVTCDPVPPPPADETDFEGFLWGIEPSPSSCTSNANASQRANCRLDDLDLTGTVKLRFQVDDGSNTQVGETNYDPKGNPPQYDINNLLLDGDKVRVCVSMGQMTHPQGGTYTLSSAKIGNKSYNVDSISGCTVFFTPPNPNGNNNLHLGFTYTALPVNDLPWYSTNNGDVFAGKDVRDRDSATAGIATGFTNNIITAGSGSVLGNSSITPTGRYANSGAKMTNMSVDPTWGLVFPNLANPPSSWETSMPNGNTFQSKIYAVSYGEFNSWLNPNLGTPPTSYSVSGTGDLAIVYVHGNAGSNTINFSRNLTANGSSRLLIITDVPVTFTGNANFGSNTISVNGAPNFQAAVVTTAGVSFIPRGGATPSKNDLSLMYKGLVATSGSDNSGSGNNVIFGWDRGTENEYPATHVNFDPSYAWLLSEFDLNADTVSGLTKVDLTWEVLD